jgi:hypothetical protein
VTKLWAGEPMARDPKMARGIHCCLNFFLFLYPDHCPYPVKSVCIILFCVGTVYELPLVLNNMDRDRSVGIATDYGLDGRGSNPDGGGGEIFRTIQDRPGGPPIHLYSGYRVFPGGKAAGAWR